MRIGIILAGCSLAVSLFCVAALEALLGWFVSAPPNLSFVRSALVDYYSTFERDVLQFNPNCARYDQQLAYRLKEGSCAFVNREFNTEVSVNSLGVRDDEDSLSGPKLIVLGDSHAMGWGVEQHQAFPSLIESKTNRKLLNVAVPSYGTVRAGLLLQRADTSQVDTLIVQYSDNDFNENRSFLEWENEFFVMTADEYQRMAKHYSDSRRYFPGKYLKDFLPLMLQHIASSDAEAGSPRDTDNEIVALANILKLLPLHKERTHLVLTEINSWGDLNGDFLGAFRKSSSFDELSAIYKKVSVQNVQAELSRSTDFFFYDTHMRPSGHEKVAAQLLDVLA